MSDNRQPYDQVDDQPDIQLALSAIGSWADEDFDEMVDALDRIRHESTPTPPLNLDV